ncbi:MAG: VCBS repeat-containing protein [Gammaproteobacteria bacterium]|nr:VCBS repeat-containing protein [Gammaproteobacteria bacterium]
MKPRLLMALPLLARPCGRVGSCFATAGLRARVRSPLRLRVNTVLRRCLLAVLASGSVAAAEPNASPFTIDEIDTGVAAHQTILLGSFTGTGRTEFGVLDGGAYREGRLRIFGLEGEEWQVVRDATVPGGVTFVDVAVIGGRDHPIFHRPGGFSAFDAAAGTERGLVSVPGHVHFTEGGRVPRIDATRDLNGDGMDDLVLPTADGFWIALQNADGTFADPAKLGPKEPHLDDKAYGDERTYGEVGITPQNLPWYLGRVHQFDYDRDGRQDLVFWNAGHFQVHRQDETGGFHTSPITFTTEAPFDFDGTYALAFQFGDRAVPALLLGLGGRFDYTVLNGFRDLNDDGIADLVTVSFSGRRVFSLRGRFDVYFGRAAPGATTFNATPDTAAETPGPAGGMAWGYATQRYMDVDSDGKTDIALAAVDTGLGGMVKAMAGKSITLDLALYRLRDNAYPKEPDAVRRVRTRFAPFDKRGVLFPLVLIGDVDGDGQADLLTGNRWDRLSVNYGGPGRDPFAGDPVHVTVDLPSNEANSMLADLNHDGRQDVVLYHPSDEAPNRLLILLGGGAVENGAGS